MLNYTVELKSRSKVFPETWHNYYLNIFIPGNQKWRIDSEEDLIYHESGFCLEVLGDKESLVMGNCDRSNERQRWIWKKYEKKAH
jgi:hypothetical protein